MLDVTQKSNFEESIKENLGADFDCAECDWVGDSHEVEIVEETVICPNCNAKDSIDKLL